MTHRTTLPNGLRLLSSFVFEDLPGGTLVRITATWGKSRKEREAMAGVRDVVADLIRPGQAILGRCWPRRWRAAPPWPPGRRRSRCRPTRSAGSSGEPVPG